VIGLEADISLSGGQLQRICGLARALLRKPALLVLDEATSALDKVSEQVVMDTVLALVRHKGMTTISVSHQPSTALDADKILVLSSDGSICQSGTYPELVQVDGIFADFVNAGGKDER
jgi:ABC-type multidrug transport system fused ATPase/permease subunit